MNTLKLKSARVGKGFNQENIAKGIGVALATYCNKENGKKLFTTKEIERLAKLLSLTTQDIDEIFFDGNLSNVINNEQAASKAS